MGGKMFYYKPEEMVKFGWKRLKDKFVPPPPTPGLRKQSPPGSNKPGYPESSTRTRPTKFNFRALQNVAAAVGEDCAKEVKFERRLYKIRDAIVKHALTQG